MARHPTIRRIAWALLGIGFLTLTVLVATGVLQRPFTPVRVSRAATLGYWAGDHGNWQVLPPDAESDVAALTGFRSPRPLVLKQLLHPGARVRLGARLPSPGTLAVAIVETPGDRERFRFTWTRAGPQISVFTCVSDARDIPLGGIDERDLLEWLQLDIRTGEQSVLIYCDHQLTGMAPLRRPLTTFHLALNVPDGRVAQVRNVWVADGATE